MSDEAWQLVVYAPAERVPFRAPPGGRWIANGLIVRHGRTFESLLINISSKDEAETLAALAAERGLHGFIRPRFGRSLATHSGSEDTADSGTRQGLRAT